jgi:IclR family transcriptional regulator, pca regulon regulatory protein
MTSVPSGGSGRGRARGAAGADARNGSEPEKRSYFVESLGRGLSVINAFSPAKTELSLRDLAEATGVSQPSAFRIGYTLIQMGYLVRNPMTKGYRPGPKLVTAGLATMASLALPGIAEPYLVELREATEETVKLAIPAKQQVVIVGWYPSERYPHDHHFLGTTLPLHATSLGRAILAWLPYTTVSAVLERAEATSFTGQTMTPAQAFDKLREIRQRGYAINDQGTTTGHRSVAAPLINPGGRPVGAINISVSAQRVSLGELKVRLAPAVVATAKSINAVLPPHVEGAGWVIP